MRFKEYNDYYGLYGGNEVLLFLSNTLQDVISEIGTLDDFIGHVGGDDFIIILNDCKNVEKIGRSLKGLSKLKTIKIKSSSIKKFEKNCIKGINKKAVIKVPKKQYKKYKKMLKPNTGFKKTMKIKKS